MRKVGRDIKDDVRDRVLGLVNTKTSRRSSHERKRVEMRFAHTDRIFKLDRPRLRGLTGARSWAFIQPAIIGHQLEPEAATHGTCAQTRRRESPRE
jgi:hypothetical protein